MHTQHKMVKESALSRERRVHSYHSRKRTPFNSKTSKHSKHKSYDKYPITNIRRSKQVTKRNDGCTCGTCDNEDDYDDYNVIEQYEKEYDEGYEASCKRVEDYLDATGQSGYKKKSESDSESSDTSSEDDSRIVRLETLTYEFEDIHQNNVIDVTNANMRVKASEIIVSIMAEDSDGKQHLTTGFIVTKTGILVTTMRNIFETHADRDIKPMAKIFALIKSVNRSSIDKVYKYVVHGVDYMRNIVVLRCGENQEPKMEFQHYFEWSNKSVYDKSIIPIVGDITLSTLQQIVTKLITEIYTVPVESNEYKYLNRGCLPITLRSITLLDVMNVFGDNYNSVVVQGLYVDTINGELSSLIKIGDWITMIDEVKLVNHGDELDILWDKIPGNTAELTYTTPPNTDEKTAVIILSKSVLKQG
uniref:Uncharacterized protein n=1 Tax=Pithovirus LCPAC404 TaxID=2506597 RepID=A0A481ZC55_9VIRU|nr:MAG: hypothetical protein LCPAC404_00710 [Pithovirus LCPAC404]